MWRQLAQIISKTARKVIRTKPIITAKRKIAIRAGELDYESSIALGPAASAA